MNNYSLIIVTIFFSAIVTFQSCKDGNLNSSTKNADEKELKTLLNEIESLTAEVSCNNPSNWRFVPIGSKPCGGATHFVLYSLDIDTKLFLQKVSEYTEKQRAFNVKYQILSDCSTIIPPKSIACIAEKATLVY
ncbi:hypothetical protein [Pedobacter sp. Leaf194]|uniref:hypothetical protein n=1 Tax=Pedobacter sp. Leaf194 TaxID=1736297 RepID=UPI000702A480|nr:hypothetical protein [Pedobacter sp. Leaf194]KQS41702.1 hypothetical protein ASG14_04420 [Pedobacter sp. Leaf194]